MSQLAESVLASWLHSCEGRAIEKAKYIVAEAVNVSGSILIEALSTCTNYPFIVYVITWNSYHTIKCLVYPLCGPIEPSECNSVGIVELEISASCSWKLGPTLQYPDKNTA